MTTVNISYSDVPGFPEGTVVDHVLVSLVATTNTNNNQSQSVPNGTTAAVFTLNPDTYTVSVWGVSAGGQHLGSPATATFVVAAPVPVTITVNLPTGVTVTP
jgi:hypothetical protein